MQKRQTKHKTHSLRVELQYMDGWTVGRGGMAKNGETEIRLHLLSEWLPHP